MSNGQDAKTPFASGGFDPASDCSEGVNVETGVDFIKDGDAGLQHTKLDDFGTFAFPTTQVDVDKSLEEFWTQTHGVRFAGNGRFDIPARSTGGHQHVGRANTRNLHRLLKRQEESSSRALGGVKR